MLRQAQLIQREGFWRTAASRDAVVRWRGLETTAGARQRAGNEDEKFIIFKDETFACTHGRRIDKKEGRIISIKNEYFSIKKQNLKERYIWMLFRTIISNQI